MSKCEVQILNTGVKSSHYKVDMYFSPAGGTMCSDESYMGMSHSKESIAY